MNIKFTFTSNNIEVTSGALMCVLLRFFIVKIEGDVNLPKYWVKQSKYHRGIPSTGRSFDLELTDVRMYMYYDTFWQALFSVGYGWCTHIKIGFLKNIRQNKSYKYKKVNFLGHGEACWHSEPYKKQKCMNFIFESDTHKKELL